MNNTRVPLPQGLHVINWIPKRSYLQEINPFSNSVSTLHNIANGVTADDEVDLCDFISIGGKVLEKIESAEIFTISFKKCDKVKTLGYSAHVKTFGGGNIDPALLFQRLMLVAKISDLDMNNILKYAMCAYPPSLFEAPQMLRKAAKAELAEAILRHMQEQESVSMVKVESNVESNNCIQERVQDVENNDHTRSFYLYNMTHNVFHHRLG